MARETINGISVPIPGTGEPADFQGDLRQFASDLSALYVATVTPEGHGTVDGVDDTAALQAAVTAASPLGAEVLIGKGRKYVIGTVTLPVGAKVRIDGTLTKKAGTQGAILSGLNADNIRVVGEGTIDGNKANQSAYTAGVGLLDFDNCDDLRVEGLTLTGHYLPTAATSADSTSSVYVRNSSRARVERVTVVDYAREGVWLKNCTDSAIVGVTALGGVDSWSGVQCSGTRNLIADCRSTDAGASGIGIDTTDSLVTGCHVRNNRYFHGFNLGHAGVPADRTVVSGCSYTLDAGVHLGLSSAANGFNVVASSVDVALAGCVSDGAKGHGFNVSDSAKNTRLSNCRATRSGLYGLNFFAAASGDSVMGSDLDLAGNSTGAHQFGGTGPAHFLLNVRTSPTSVSHVVTSATVELPTTTARGNFLVSPANGTDYRDLGVQRVSGANTYKMVMAASGTSTLLVASRDGSGFATLSVDYNGGTPRFAPTVPIKLPSYTTALRPSASALGAGSQIYDSTLGYAITSNGSAWVNGVGTVV